MNKLTSNLFLPSLMILCLLTAESCRDNDGSGLTGERIIIIEPEVTCNPGFVLAADGETCLCPEGRYNVGAGDCLESLPADFAYAPLPDCFGRGIAIRLDNSSFVPVDLSAGTYQMGSVDIISPNKSNDVTQVESFRIFYQERQDGLQHVLFRFRLSEYFTQEEYATYGPGLRFDFEGFLAPDGVLSGTLSYGTGQYYSEQDFETFGSCEAEWVFDQ